MGGAVVHVALDLGLPGRLGLALVMVMVLLLALDLAVCSLNEDIDAAVLGVEGLVVEVGFGEFGDDVPRVEEAGDVSEDEEEDVDY
jgi:hypothetical protein